MFKMARILPYSKEAIHSDFVQSFNVQVKKSHHRFYVIFHSKYPGLYTQSSANFLVATRCRGRFWSTHFWIFQLLNSQDIHYLTKQLVNLQNLVSNSMRHG
uniref:Uncharacterized protein n=1 Tax=Trichuris muris TaxID=70415 RepID=A0A5S6QHU2_TRIMR